MERTALFLEQLELYEPADEVERRHRRDHIELVAGRADPFSRATFQPGHITGSCFIVDDAGRLLLHHHRRLGRWLQMGGHLEPGERPVDAALREGAEESGLVDLVPAFPAILDLDIHRIPAGRGEPDHRHFDVRYLARTSRPEAIMMDGAESLELVWVDLEEAEKLMGSLESRRVISKISGVLCRN